MHHSLRKESRTFPGAIWTGVLLTHGVWCRQREGGESARHPPLSRRHGAVSGPINLGDR